MKKSTKNQSFAADDFTNGEFKTIHYKDIDLEDTKVLLKKQGLLIVELKWPRAWTLISLLRQEENFLSGIKKKRPNLFYRLLTLIFDFFYLIPLVLISSNIVVLHCIYVNHCNAAEWKKLPNGNYQFVLM